MLSSLKKLLETNRVAYEPLRHPPAFTAQEVAAAEHVPGREHAKVTVVRAGDRLLFAVLPASKKVDLDKLAALVPEKSARLSSEEEFRDRCAGCEPGAMPPFGSLFGMETIVDRSLEQDERIVFQAGTHEESVRMRYADFKRLAHPRIEDFTS